MKKATENDFFAALGLANASREEQLEVLQKFEQVAREKVIAVILNSLDEQALEALDALVQSGADEMGILVFLRAQIPSLDEQIQSELTSFKQTIIQNVAAVKTTIVAIRDIISATRLSPQARNQDQVEANHLEYHLNRLLLQQSLEELTSLLQRAQKLQVILESR